MHDIKDKQLRIDQLKIRVEECRNFIDDIFEDKFAQSTLGFSADVQLDLERFSIGGHSFGGMTAIATAQ